MAGFHTNAPFVLGTRLMKGECDCEADHRPQSRVEACEFARLGN